MNAAEIDGRNGNRRNRDRRRVCPRPKTKAEDNLDDDENNHRGVGNRRRRDPATTWSDNNLLLDGRDVGRDRHAPLFRVLRTFDAALPVRKDVGRRREWDLNRVTSAEETGRRTLPHPMVGRPMVVDHHWERVMAFPDPRRNSGCVLASTERRSVSSVSSPL